MVDISSIISAALSAAVTLVVCLVNNHFQVSKTIALIDFRLQELQKKVDKHNQIVERMYAVEKKTDLQDEEIQRHKERIKLVEEAQKRQEGDGR